MYEFVGCIGVATRTQIIEWKEMPWLSVKIEEFLSAQSAELLFATELYNYYEGNLE